MSEHELCEAAKHPVVLKDSKVKVSLGCFLTVTMTYVHAFHTCRLSPIMTTLLQLVLVLSQHVYAGKS